MEFNILGKVVSNVNNWYDFTNIDSVSITLVFITIITLFCMVYNLLAFLREKCCSDEGLESSPESSISTAQCSTKIEGNKQPVPRDSAGYADKIQDIHLYAARMHQKAYEERCIALLKKYPDAINTPKPPSMYTPFLRACWCGNTRVVAFMLKNGADITSHTKEGDSPIYLAVYSITKQPQAFDPVCINILYNAGCNVNTPKNHGYTPLHLAAKAGNADLVQWLLLRGADPDRVTECNKKAVDFARKYGHRRVVSLLAVCIDDEVYL